MEAFSNAFAFLAGAPAIIGLFLTALIIFLTADWRLSLAALLVQYVLAGLALTHFIQSEIVVVKILAGVLVVPILYLGARRTQDMRDSQGADGGSSEPPDSQLEWGAGPMSLVLHLLAVLLVVLALIRLFGTYRLPLVSIDIAFVAIWMGSMGLIGLVLAGGPLRVAPALLTILAGFDLVYATIEPSLAIAGFFGALTLLTALAFSYLVAVQTVGNSPQDSDEEGAEL